jgi:transposase-like protein
MPPGESIARARACGSSSIGRRYWRRNEEDVRRWAELFRDGKSIVRIAAEEGVDPGTVSSRLHRLGLDIKRGQHHVEQLPLKYSPEFIDLTRQGPDRVLDFVRQRVWGIAATDRGREQLDSFCEFVHLHQQGVGVEEIARRLALHRSTVAEWREGTDQSYIIRALKDTIANTPREGWKLLPMHLKSGGGEPSGWMQVPVRIQSYADVLGVIGQLRPLEKTYERAPIFGLARDQIDAMRPVLFAYLLGVMIGDSGKLGGVQNRYASMNLDLQLTKKHQTNERLGEFTCVCANSLGLVMDRKRDKPPTGATRHSREPTPAFRWISERSPLFAWIFSTCLGLQWEETTTTHKLRMNWVFGTPVAFRTRLIQGVADSDGCVKRYVVEIESVPNTHFLVEILRSLGMTTAHVGYENGVPEKVRMNTKQALMLPIFNEHVRSYRYQKMTTQPTCGTRIFPMLSANPAESEKT